MKMPKRPMSEQMKKTSKKLFWGVFILWNAFILYVVSGKKELPQAQIKNVNQTVLVQNNNAPIKPMHMAKQEVKTVFETENAIYSFDNEKLTCVHLQKYHTKSDRKTNVPIIEKEPVKVEWLGEQPDINANWKITKNNDGIAMQHTNSNKVTFIQNWYFDKNAKYAIAVETKVINESKKDIQTQAIITMKKKEFEQQQSFVFSGVSLYGNGKLKNINPKSFTAYSTASDKGWAAFNEKYWLVAAASNNSQNILTNKTTVVSDYNMEAHDVASKNVYSIKVVNKAQQVGIKSSVSDKFDLYLGPKSLNELKEFGQIIGMKNIESSIDYGWLFFLTKPVNYMLHTLINKLASIVWALIILTVLLKLLSWPFTRSSHVAMQKLQQINPEIAQIKERLKGNPELMNREIFALYKKYKINPISGCLPSVLQMLFLFPLYKVLSVSIDLRCASFPFWIKDLSAPDPTSILNLFGLLPFKAPDILSIGAWPVLMGITMFAQQMISGTPSTNKEGKMLQYMLPVFFTWIMASVASGVVIYWTLTNVLTVAQLLWINYSESKKKGSKNLKRFK